MSTKIDTICAIDICLKRIEQIQQTLSKHCDIAKCMTTPRETYQHAIDRMRDMCTRVRAWIIADTSVSSTHNKVIAACDNEISWIEEEVCTMIARHNWIDKIMLLLSMNWLLIIGVLVIAIYFLVIYVQPIAQATYANRI